MCAIGFGEDRSVRMEQTYPFRYPSENNPVWKTKMSEL